MRKAVPVLLVIFLATLGPASAACKPLHRGTRVVLYSTTDDPSVLIWDSRSRLREYYAASFDEAQAILPHAILVAPGTHADVMSCVAGYVESPVFHAPDDAVGVTITSGPHRGVIRWVLGSDVRTIHR